MDIILPILMHQEVEEAIIIIIIRFLEAGPRRRIRAYRAFPHAHTEEEGQDLLARMEWSRRAGRSRSPRRISR